MGYQGEKMKLTTEQALEYVGGRIEELCQWLDDCDSKSSAFMVNMDALEELEEIREALLSDKFLESSTDFNKELFGRE